jgi:hypothetical protein
MGALPPPGEIVPQPSRAASSIASPRAERLIAYLLVLLAIAFNLHFLHPEVAIKVPDLNDEVLHLLNLERTVTAFFLGQDPTDSWLAPIDLGYPLFHYYQHLPYLPPAILYLLFRGNLSLLDIFNWTGYLLLSLFPLSIYWSMRRFGFSRLQASLTGLVAPLLATNYLYGFDFNSYVWRGSGLYTQLWGMVLLPLTLAQGYAVLRTGRGHVWAVLLLSATLLSHLIFGYIATLSLFLLALVPAMRRPTTGSVLGRIWARSRRWILLLILLGLAAAYFLVPFWLDRAYLNRSVWEASWKYDAYGYEWTLRTLARGELLDYGRFPSLTILAAIGLAYCVRRWKQERYRLLTVLFIFWLLLYFGRPTWGVLLDLLPMSRDLHLHRLIAGVHLGAIYLMGLGLAVPWRWAMGRLNRWHLVAPAILTGVLLYPVYKERADYLVQNSRWMTESQQAFEAEAKDLEALISNLRGLPPGRVYAGLGGTWGKDYKVGGVPVHALLNRYGLDMLGFLWHALSFNADILVLFDESRAEQYNLFNVRYVVAPAGRTFPDFVKPLGSFGRHRLYEVETTGYFDLVGSDVAFSGDKSEFYPAASRWLVSDMLLAKQHPALFLEGNAPDDQASTTLAAATEMIPRLSFPGGLPRGRVISETVRPGSYLTDLEVERDSVLMLKVTYHPNWHAYLDGVEANTIMVMPSYIGVKVPPGAHQVRLDYQPQPVRGALRSVGVLALALIALAEARRREFSRLIRRLHMRFVPRRFGVALLALLDGLDRPGRIRDPLLELRLATTRAYQATVELIGRISARFQGIGLARHRFVGRASITERHLLWALSLAGLGSGIVVIAGLLMPGSVFKFPYSIATNEPLTVIYSFPGGRNYVVLTLGLLCVLFLAALVVAQRLPSQRATVVALLGSLVLIGMYVPVYPGGSTDLFHYMADTRTLWVYGENPVRVPPYVHRDDPISSQVIAWGNTPSVYGPLTYVAYGIPRKIAGDGLIQNLVAFKAFNGLILLMLSGLVGYAAGRLTPSRRAQAIVMVGWNPLLLYETVGNGHNDVLMMLLALGSLVLACRSATTRSFLTLALSVGMKFVTSSVAPVMWLWLWLNSGRRQRTRLIALGLSGVAVATALYAMFGRVVLTSPEAQADRPAVRSPVSVVGYGLEPWLGSEAFSLGRYLLLALFAVLSLAAVARINRTPRSLYRVSFWVLTTAALLTVRQVYPWYLVWFIPLGAVLLGSLEADVGVLASIAGLLSYAFFPWEPFNLVNNTYYVDPVRNALYVSIFFGGPLLYLMLGRSLRLPTTGRSQDPAARGSLQGALRIGTVLRALRLNIGFPAAFERFRSLGVIFWANCRARGKHLSCHLPFIASLGLFALVAGLPLLRSELMSGHDSFAYLPRNVEFYEVLSSGQLVPRWAPDLGAGYGEPTFNFNPPLVYYFSALFHALGAGFPASENLASLFLLFMAALGMYSLGSDLFGRKGGVISALAYLFAPYLLVTLYVRHALADFSAFAFIPFALWGIYRFAGAPHYRFLVIGALALGLLLLSNTLVSLITFPVIMLLVGWLAWVRQSWGSLLRGLSTIMLALGLSAFFWIPALAEARFVHTSRWLERFNYHDHFLYPSQLVNSPWGYGLSLPGPGDGMSFAIGPVHLLLLVVSLLLFRRIGTAVGQGRVLVGLSYVVLLVSAFMASNLSAFLWERISLLQLLQFPWRFLSLIAVTSALICGAPYILIRETEPWIGRILMGALVAGLLLWGFPHARPMAYFSVNEDDFSPDAIANRGVAATGRELEPIWVQEFPQAPARERVTILEGDGHIVPVAVSSTEYVFNVDVTVDARLRVNTFYFPGWVLYVDGAARPIDHQNPQGLMEFSLEEGRHLVEVRFGDTPVRLWSARLSLAAVAVLLITPWLVKLSPRISRLELVIAAVFRRRRPSKAVVSEPPSDALVPVLPSANAHSPAHPSADLKTKLGIYLLFLSIYLMSSSGHFFSTDQVAVYLTTKSLVEDHSLAIKPMNDTFVGADGRAYGVYGLGQSILSIPLYLVGSLVDGMSPAVLREYWSGPDLGDWGGTVPIFFVSLFNQFVTPLSCVLLFLLCRQFGFSVRASLFTTLIFGLGTATWVYAREYFQHALETFFLLMSFYILFSRKPYLQPRHALLAGMSLALGVLTRINLLLVAPAMFAYLIIIVRNSAPRPLHRGKTSTRSYASPVASSLAHDCGPAPFRGLDSAVLTHAVSFLAPVVAALGFILFINEARFGDYFAFNPTALRHGFSIGGILEGLYGNLFTVGRSVFLYSPPLLVGLYFVSRKLLEAHRLEAILFLSIGAIYVFFYSAYGGWDGGWSWGPRFLVATLPFLTLPIAYAFASKRATALATVFAVIGLGIQILGSVINVSYIHYDWMQMELSPENAYLFVPAISPIPSHLMALVEGRHIDLWLLWVYQGFGLAALLITTVVPLLLLGSSVLLLRRVRKPEA